MKKFEFEASQIVARIRADNTADVSDVVDTLLEKFEEEVAKRRRDLLAHFLLILFNFDAEKCLRNLTKAIALNPENCVPTDKERTKLFMCLWFVVKQHYADEDYAEVLDEISRIYIYRIEEEENGEQGLPFV